MSASGQKRARMAIFLQKLSRANVAGITKIISATGAAGWNGAEGQNRTVDTSLFRAVLCQLSYLGTKKF